MKPIRIAIVDDHDLFREGIKLVLSQINDFEVVFDTNSGIAFLDFLSNETPDIALMDIEMPVINGIDTTRKALEIVAEGGNYFSHEIMQKLANQHINKQNKNDSLTKREKDILYHICKGSTSKEISEKLFISIKTVETHRANIFSKTNVRNTAELIIWAVKNNQFSIN